MKTFLDYALEKITEDINNMLISGKIDVPGYELNQLNKAFIKKLICETLKELGLDDFRSRPNLIKNHCDEMKGRIREHHDNGKTLKWKEIINKDNIDLLKRGEILTILDENDNPTQVIFMNDNNEIINTIIGDYHKQWLKDNGYQPGKPWPK